MFASSMPSMCPPSRLPLRWLCLGVAASCLLGSSCAVDSDPLFERATPLEPTASRPGNLPTFPQPSGSGGRSGTSATGVGSDGVTGEAIQGLLGSDAGSVDAGAPSADGGSADAACQLAVECDDGNECTLDECSAGTCRSSAHAAGVACGGAQQGECTQPDTCDGAGSCVLNHAPASTPCGRATSAGCTADACDGAGVCQAVDVAAGTPCGDDSGGCSEPVCDGAGVCEPSDEPNGAACPGGSCSVGACIAGQPVGCPAAVVSPTSLAVNAPLQSSWSSVGRPSLIQGSCGSQNTPDFALVFTAPSAGEYRFDVSGTADSVLVVRAGACAGGNEIACNDDVNDDTRDSRLQLALTAGQTITLYVSEFGNGSTGAGTVRITLR
jgi:hypothetical protein